MINRYYVEMVKRAVEGGDDAMIMLIANQLSDCQDAKLILRLKGWGDRFMSTGETARLVPSKV